MADNSKIEWTEASWNPVTGCTEVSPGCDNCYAKTFAERWRGTPGHHFENGFDVTLRPERLDQPLRWRRPRRIFVNSMSDLFHDAVPDLFITQVFDVMERASQHTFQVLTKRHARMRNLMNDGSFRLFVQRCAVPLAKEHGLNTTWAERVTDPRSWPLDNVWLGCSVENQKWADIRIPALRETPAAVRMLSCEPLLGPLSLDLTGIGWVIAGGESGPGARPMYPSWARSLRDQCRMAEIPFFFKQFGEYAPRCTLALCGELCACNGVNASHPIEMKRVGKKAAGRDLDGRTWDQYPAGDRTPSEHGIRTRGWNRGAA